MNSAENELIKFFEKFQFSIEKIPESSEKTPDFLVNKNNELILLELKTRFDNQEFKERRDQALNDKGVFEYVTLPRRSNSISKKINIAVKQLKTQKIKYHPNYCFIAYVVKGVSTSNQINDIEATLMGTKQIIPLESKIENGVKKCYYYTNSDFYNFRDCVDGAFVIGENGFYLYINNHSKNYAELADSEFIRSFSPHVVDPYELVESGSAYIIDSSIPRIDEEKLNEFICDKYNFEKILAINIPTHTIISKL